MTTIIILSNKSETRYKHNDKEWENGTTEIWYVHIHRYTYVYGDEQIGVMSSIFCLLLPMKADET